MSLALLILSGVGVGAGVGWWIHPGLGLAISSLALGGVALFRDVGAQQKGHGR